MRTSDNYRQQPPRNSNLNWLWLLILAIATIIGVGLFRAAQPAHAEGPRGQQTPALTIDVTNITLETPRSQVVGGMFRQQVGTITLDPSINDIQISNSYGDVGLGPDLVELAEWHSDIRTNTLHLVAYAFLPGTRDGPHTGTTTIDYHQGDRWIRGPQVTYTIEFTRSPNELIVPVLNESLGLAPNDRVMRVDSMVFTEGYGGIPTRVLRIITERQLAFVPIGPACPTTKRGITDMLGVPGFVGGPLYPIADEFWTQVDEITWRYQPRQGSLAFPIGYPEFGHIVFDDGYELVPGDNIQWNLKPFTYKCAA